MADCKACGAWFGTATPKELCPTCERALKRLNGYAVPVVRCKDCKWGKTWKNSFGIEGFKCDLLCVDLSPEAFCSYGERKEG